MKDPLVGLLVGAFGVLATLVGIYVAARAQRRSTEQIVEIKNALTESFAHAFADEQIAEGIAPGPPATAFSGPAGAAEPATPIPGDPPLAASAETFAQEPAEESRGGLAGGKLAGTADLTGNDSADLLLEQAAPGGTALKIFTWAGFDLVLSAELTNNTGAHFVIDPTDPRALATLNLAEGRLIEDTWIWSEDRLVKRASKVPRDPDRFAATPTWSA